MIYVNSSTGAKDATGTSQNDTIHATVDGHPSRQIHLFGLKGDDTFYLNLNTVNEYDHIKHGHHVHGGEGENVFIFKNTADMTGTIVGRFEDYSDSKDLILIDNEILDPYNPEQIEGAKVKIVSYLGQQWLDIRNDNGGRAFYALEAPRTDPLTGKDEPHFLAWNHPLPDTLPAASYVDRGVDNDSDRIPEHHHDHHHQHPDLAETEYPEDMDDDSGSDSGSGFEGFGLLAALLGGLGMVMGMAG